MITVSRLRVCDRVWCKHWEGKEMCLNNCRPQLSVISWNAGCVTCQLTSSLVVISCCRSRRWRRWAARLHHPASAFVAAVTTGHLPDPSTVGRSPIRRNRIFVAHDGSPSPTSRVNVFHRACAETSFRWPLDDVIIERGDRRLYTFADDIAGRRLVRGTSITTLSQKDWQSAAISMSSMSYSFVHLCPQICFVVSCDFGLLREYRYFPMNDTGLSWALGLIKASARGAGRVIGHSPTANNNRYRIDSLSDKGYAIVFRIRLNSVLHGSPWFQQGGGHARSKLNDLNQNRSNPFYAICDPWIAMARQQSLVKAFVRLKARDVWCTFY